MRNPYLGLPDICFWNKVMSPKAPWEINPANIKLKIKPDEKIVTMGSCFAQHIARHMSRVGLNYYVTEFAPGDMGAAEAARRNYGVFSARYGNLYTVRQTLQLCQRAFDKYSPEQHIWKRGAALVDGFRPQIEPDGFIKEDELISSRQKHLECVKKMFLEADWIVFTLGLTEAWISKSDGAVFPLAPGVAGGKFDSSLYEFRNFSLDEVKSDLFKFIEEIKYINAKAKFLLTVSPVPLMATYERRHVLVSTTVSKSILRVAVDEAERAFDNVIYFPSYEIITSPATCCHYYADDYRQVKEEGVAHVMRVFSEMFLETAAKAAAPIRSARVKEGVICDEEILGR